MEDDGCRCSTVKIKLREIGEGGRGRHKMEGWLIDWGVLLSESPPSGTMPPPLHLVADCDCVIVFPLSFLPSSWWLFYLIWCSDALTLCWEKTEVPTLISWGFLFLGFGGLRKEYFYKHDTINQWKTSINLWMSQAAVFRPPTSRMAGSLGVLWLRG